MHSVMDSKTFMTAPEHALIELGLAHDNPAAQELILLSEELHTLKSTLKETKKNKAEVAHQFKHVSADSSDHPALIAAMQQVSEQLKLLDERYKAANKLLTVRLTALTANKSAPIADSTIAAPTGSISASSLLPTDKSTETQKNTPPFVFIPTTQQYSGDYKIAELVAAEQGAWQAFVASQATTLYHQPAWANIIQASFGRPTRVWVARSASGEILAGLPLTFFASKLFGRFAVSIPYFNYGGVISPWFNIAQALLAYLPSVCASEGLSHIEVRSMQADLAERASSKKVSMVLELPTTEAQLDENLGAKVRAQIKKAEQYTPSIRFGKLELLDDFYRVFTQNMRDLGTPVYAREWFANILRHPEVSAQLAVVFVAGQPVSAGFVVGYRGMLEIPWASTIKKANTMNTNMWLYRQILGYAIRADYQFFDFGRSTQGAGTYRFKKQWGAQAYPHYWYTLVPAGTQAPELNPDNPKFRLMIAVWKRLPVWLTKIIGPPIVANLP